MSKPDGVIPYIDPNIRHVGTSYLRELDADALEKLDYPVVIGIDPPLAVLVPYDVFMSMQEIYHARFG